MSENIHHLSGNLLVGSSHFFVDTTNNRVGITTADPDAGLHVNSNAYVHTDFRVGSGIVMNVTGGRITAGSFEGDGSLLENVPGDSGSWVNGTNSNVHLSTSTNKVGIGVVSPGAELHVGGTGAIIVPSGTTGDRPATAANGMFRYNTETGYMESYTASGWGALATPPSITGISPLVVAVADTATQVFTVSGASFDTGLAINLVGADGTEYEVVDRTFVNTATTTFKMGDLSSATAQVANRPYKVKVTGGSGLATTSIQTIGFSGTSWTSPAAGATLSFSTVASESQTLAGTDVVGGNNVTFEVAPGSALPGGLSLDESTGVISGTIGAASATNVTFRVVDTPSQAFVERTFSIVGVAPLYSFSTHTFTNAAKTGRYGPTLSELRTAYTPTWTDYTSNLNVTTQGIQEWTVPVTGTYRITAIGAKGGTGTGSALASYEEGGKGAWMRGEFTLSINETLHILVGHQGGSTGRAGMGGGGGGGTFVSKGTTLANSVALIAAGGGGGGSYSYVSNVIGNPGLVTIGNWPYAGAANSSYATDYEGAGFAGNATSGGSNAAKAFKNGGVGGLGEYSDGPVGGFGGGGGSASSYPSGGGGGGYQGGAAGQNSWNQLGNGGGGLSYNDGANSAGVSGSSSANGNGSVIILKL